MASKTSSPRKRASPTTAAPSEDAASMTVHYSEGDTWPGASRSDVGRSHGTDLLQSVRRWETEVAPTSLPDSNVRGWEWMHGIREPGNPKSGRFMNAATARFWTIWVLSQDWGREPVVHFETRDLDLMRVEGDLARTMTRSKYDSAEGWAARIEWLFLPPRLELAQFRSGEVEVARLIGRLDVLREKANATDQRIRAAKAPRGFKATLPHRLEQAYSRDQKWIERPIKQLAQHIQDQANMERARLLKEGRPLGPRVPSAHTIEGQIADLRRTEIQ
jgi:hypothetical protein